MRLKKVILAGAIALSSTVAIAQGSGGTAGGTAGGYGTAGAVGTGPGATGTGGTGVNGNAANNGFGMRATHGGGGLSSMGNSSSAGVKKGATAPSNNATGATPKKAP